MFEAVKLSMKNWDSDNLPREKMIKYGIKALSDAELLAIVINSGSKNESALELAKRILQDNQNELDDVGKLSVERLKSYKGIGLKKATNILASLELGRRRLMTNRNKILKISCSNDAFEILRIDISDLSHEEFWVLYLDRSNKVIDKKKISQGGISGTVIDVRIILKQAIEKLASAIILSHNHPSGNVRPSQNDLDITKKTVEAARLVDIKVLDHLIICGSEYLSLADEGLIT